MRDVGAPGSVTLRVDPIRCDGVGICAHLAPDLITIDRWGFPIFPRRALTPEETEQARRAVRGCPMQALILDGLRR